MTTEEEKTLRGYAAMLVRQWAEKRTLFPGSGGPAGGRTDRVYLNLDERALFDACADDIERGIG